MAASRIPRRAAYVILGAALILTLILVGRIVYHEYALAGYVKTKAQVVHSQTVLHHSSRRSHDSKEYALTYRYQVNSSTYESNARTLRNSPSMVGKTVSIRYDPENPSLIDNGAALRGNLMVLAVLVLADGFLLFALAGGSKPVRSRKDPHVS